jgi:anti-sigma-K factor RskA
LAERIDIHVDLGAYLLGRLTPEEAARIEEHMSVCESCRAAAAELEGTAALLARAAAPVAPPADLEARTLAAVRAAAGAPAEPRPARRPRRMMPWRRLAFAGGLAALLAAAVLAGSQLGGGAGLPGSPELEATLVSPSGDRARASVRKTGIGRVVEFRTNQLPILPEGEYYELWFVGPGDRPGRPNRISAGTFHPDEQGRSHVRFAAAVDPEKYPRLAVTAEPGDGDPSPSGPDVMRSPGKP